MGVGVSPTPRPPLTPGKIRYPLYRRLGWPQRQSVRAENLVPTGIRFRTVHPAVSRYTDWGVRPTFMFCRLLNNKCGYLFRAGNLRNDDNYLPVNMYHLATVKSLIMQDFEYVTQHRFTSQTIGIFSSNLKPRKQNFARCKKHPRKENKSHFACRYRKNCTTQMEHQLDATLCRFYFCRVTLHVSGASAHHQEYLKLLQRPLVHVFCKNI
jgi:hypothetical protein